MVFNIFLEKNFELTMNYDSKCDPPICFYPTIWTALPQMSSESPFSHASALCSWPFSIMLSQTDPYEITCISTHSIKDCMQLLPKLYISSPSTYKIRCVHTHTHTHGIVFLCSLFFRTGNEATYCICSMYTRMKSKSQPFYIRFISLGNGVIPGL